MVNRLKCGATMGQFDSSRTRVVPIFTRFLCIDPTGRSRLQNLLDLATRTGRVQAAVGTSPLREAWCWPSERKLAPPLSLLTWLVKNVAGPTTDDGWGEGEVRKRREALVRGDPAVVAEALARLEAGPAERDWAVLEGPSQPDVFLGTDEVLVVIEGKRTESGPTTKTTWMPVRHQMLRHLDAAWEIRGSRTVYGLFIVEADPEAPAAIPPVWEDFAKSTISAGPLAGSLPHRTPEEQRWLAEAFLGVTTWQRVCARFDIPKEVLIDAVI
jgi:hypothetical protein